MNYLFSTVSVADTCSWFEVPLFPAIFIESGCPVYFWSNQLGTEETNLNAWDVKASFLNLTDISIKNFTKRNPIKYKYDGDLLSSFFESRDSDGQQKSLDIIHLMGSHVAPQDRYPNEFAVFKDEDYSYRQDLNKEQRAHIANYDNSVLYNDHILGRILDYYRDKNSIVIYLSDHGDEVNDFRSHIGRAFDFKETGKQVFQNQLDVPFIIYVSEKYKEQHSNIVQRLANSVDIPFVTDKTSQILLDIAGINSKWCKPELCPINNNYIYPKRYFINPTNDEIIDYDAYCSPN